ncbi:FAD-dependent oxidoreductase [Subtercola sp. PAMC28395]|uniref:FAD-binding oxidoreductase n=1 Tax=Subtercola sp. PAMC28395 TaxID=2846775 RepID=UPI001C0D0C42|nr:FAD-dependent oxidoreductase [Subtercola sp. PAMC28395]QWT24736.1 FAD-dependent oxidoreductase [Subtercola sp. PAMC28395]
MTALSRRQFLLTAGSSVAAASVLAACSSPAPAPPVSPTPTPTPVGPPVWAELSQSVKGAVLLPADANYGTAKLTENPRFDDAAPLAILEASSAADVAAGLAFATKYGVPLALRSGGHNYVGWSAGGASGSGVPPSLVISTATLTEVTLSADGSTVQVGAGASLAEVYNTVGTAGRAIAGGSCATVGVTGLTLGGGVGVLVRSFGLACDQLTGVEIVTADGVVHQASASNDADLFWASQGGGGGMLGVVTGLTFATRAAPDVTTWYVEWPWSAAAEVVAAWQTWAPSADNGLWSTLKLLGGNSHPGEPSVSVSGTWIGSGPLSQQIAPLLNGVSAQPSTNQPFHHSYVDAMMIEAGCQNTPIAECNTGPGGALTREPSSGTSNIGYATLDASGITDLIAQVNAAQNVSGMTEGGISMDALGGVVANIDPSATAFVHRKALMTVQYTATFAVGADPSPYDAYVRRFRAAMTTHWQNWAYVNYCDATVPDAQTAYFGANLPRLTSLKAQYDPHGLFTQPQSY